MLERVAQQGSGLARLHAIWGLGQIGHKNAKALKSLPTLIADRQAEVRGQALKVLASARPDANVWDTLLAAMSDPEPRVRYFATLAAAQHLGLKTVVAVCDMLRANADADPYLRHAGVMALSNMGAMGVRPAAEDPSPSVRLAALLAMRRVGNVEITRFLKDSEPKLMLEAARAIYDVPIAAALPRLAELTQPGGGAKALAKEVQEPVLLRALAAHHRLGTKADVQALAEFAVRGDFPEKLRTEALKLLALWEKPPGRDRVVGLWRPLPECPAADVAEAIRPALAGIMTGPNAVRTEGAKLAARHGIQEIAPVLRELVADTRRPSAVRVATLRALESLRDAQLMAVARAVTEGDDPRLRAEGQRVVLGSLAKTDAQDAVKKLEGLIEKAPSTIERQGALAVLAGVPSAQADVVIGGWLDLMARKQAPPELELEILEAARKRVSPDLQQKLARYEKSRPDAKSVAAYREALAGGDADAGRAIFFDKSEVSCLRCHKVGGVGGEVGPDLTGIGSKQKRDYLLESIVDPNKEIAKGFESVVLVLTDGQTKTGILKSEDAREVRLMTAEGQLIAVAKDRIDERLRGPSAMPADLAQKLSGAELRDLVEYLASLRETVQGGPKR